MASALHRSGGEHARDGRRPARVLVVGADSPDALTGLASPDTQLRVVGGLGEAAQAIVAEPPAAVLLYGNDHLAATWCEVLRALGDFPIIVCPRPIPVDVATACLDRGADLVLTHEVPAEELAERLAALLRRAEASSEPLEFGDIVIDLESATVTRRGEPVTLSPTEFRVLATLAKQPGQVVATRDILREVWGEEFVDDIHYVRLYIGYLRSKLEDDPSRPQVIVNHRGAGYRLVDHASPRALET